jgi:hypothetical protein
MKTLTFLHADLITLRKSAMAHWANGVRPLYEQVTGRGYWLVGDEGVYLMHNGQLAKDEKPVVAYAVQCNPKTMDFDAWWQNKRDSFGGDDGVEFIDPDLINSAIYDGVSLDVTFENDQMIFSIVMREHQ